MITSKEIKLNDDIEVALDQLSKTATIIWTKNGLRTKQEIAKILWAANKAIWDFNKSLDLQPDPPRFVPTKKK